MGLAAVSMYSTEPGEVWEYAVRLSDGTITVCGEDTKHHSGKWLAERMLERAKNPPEGAVIPGQVNDPDPGARIVRRKRIKIYGAWEEDEHDNF